MYAIRSYYDFFALVMPDQLPLVKQHREKRPIFSRYQIEEQIEGLARNQVPLPSGGSIVIDQTEALVAIDVNSGRMAGEQGIEATAFKSNMEAAAEIGRQLRLRRITSYNVCYTKLLRPGPVHRPDHGLGFAPPGEVNPCCW